MSDAMEQAFNKALRGIARDITVAAFGNDQGASALYEVIHPHLEQLVGTVFQHQHTVRADEREQCAKVAEHVLTMGFSGLYGEGMNDAATHIAATIRERSAL